jgi:hypothetical protein
MGSAVTAAFVAETEVIVPEKDADIRRLATDMAATWNSHSGDGLTERRFMETTVKFISGDEIVSPISVRRFIILGAAAWALAACATSGLSHRQAEQDDIEQFQSATQTAVECRTTAASNPRYSVLTAHMPLDDLSRATLPQMIDQHHATIDEVTALDGWTHDVGACRDLLLRVTYANVPSFGPIIEQARDKDDSVYVMLAHHKLTWGQGVMRLKADQTELRTALITRADEIMARVGTAQEAERNRRATILSSVIRILP